MATYTVPSGDRIWAGRDVVMPDPDDVSFTWPPGPNCVIPDAEGVNAPIHPKVLDFGTAWNGYRYWMAYTPYPIGNDDTKENPCVAASNDGDTWVEPATNPIVPAPTGASSTKFNSDTHLEYKEGLLYLFWRLYDESLPIASGRWKLKYKVSSDGENWSDEVVFYSTVVAESTVLSPSITWHDGYWWMWTYRSDEDPIVCDLRRATTLSGLQSVVATECALTLPDATYEPWHFDVVRIPNGWGMLITDRNRTTNASGHLWLAIADDDGLVWDVKSTSFSALSPKTYRSSIVKNADNSGFECWVTDWDARKIRRLSLALGV